MSDVRLSESEREQFVANLRQNLGYAISPIIAATLCGHVEHILATRLGDRDAAGVEARVRALRDARAAHEWPVETDDGLDYSRCACGARPPYSPGGSEDGFWWADHHDHALVAALSGPADAHPADGTTP